MLTITGSKAEIEGFMQRVCFLNYRSVQGCKRIKNCTECITLNYHTKVCVIPDIKPNTEVFVDEEKP